MQFVVVGLGNKGEDYRETRHNVGWLALDKFYNDFSFGNWSESGKNKGEIAEGKVGKTKVVLLKPHTMMNGSGNSVKTLIRSKKDAQNLIVLHDDLDLPLGVFKIVYNRGSGGHRGVGSIQKNLGTNEFVRIKIGVSPRTSSGKARKPKGDEKVLDFIIGKFKKTEKEIIKKVFKDISGAIESIIIDGRQLAMTDWN